MLRLAYGDTFIEYDFTGFRPVQVIEPVTPPGKNLDSRELVEQALANPVGCPSLLQLAQDKEARNAVIVVNDVTRPTPYEYILPPLIRELNAAGISDGNITLLVATGIHRPHNDEDNIFCYGEEICQRLAIVNHDCDHDTVKIGTLFNGMELAINRLAVNADLLITTGLVSLHYIAGYSGGRKSILPGIAARPAIEASHKLMNDQRACLANIDDNPVNALMLEASAMAGVDFIINVVGTHHAVEFAAAGDLVEAWLETVQFCQEASVVTAASRTDVVVASCGGYPKDINVYQAQKALDTAAMAVKPGGTIILLAECREGLGEEVFTEWVKSARCREDIIRRFHTKFELGGHKAFAICRILDHADVLMVSSLADAEAEELYIMPSRSLDTALEWAQRKHGKDMTITIMPQAPKTAVKISGHPFQDFETELTIERDVPLKLHSTYLIGGPADFMAFPENSRQVAALIARCKESNMPYLVIGKGSNLLFHDLGFRGLVINMSGSMNGLQMLGHSRIIAGAGVYLHDLSVFALYNHLAGMEFCEGIPGTVGGALYMNAGAYGGTIATRLENALVIDENGREMVLNRDELGFGERTSRLQTEQMIVIQATFALDIPGPDDYSGFRDIFAEMRRCIRLRATFQPALDDMDSPDLDPQPSAGSVFGRIKGLPPEECAPKYWIKEAGLEGLELGGAVVSPKHPNFIVNFDNATAADVRSLINLVKGKVEKYIFAQRQVKVCLEPEVICLDEYGQRILCE